MRLHRCCCGLSEWVCVKAVNMATVHMCTLHFVCRCDPHLLWAHMAALLWRGLCLRGSWSHSSAWHACL